VRSKLAWEAGRAKTGAPSEPCADPLATAKAALAAAAAAAAASPESPYHAAALETAEAAVAAAEAAANRSSGASSHSASPDLSLVTEKFREAVCGVALVRERLHLR